MKRKFLLYYLIFFILIGNIKISFNEISPINYKRQDSSPKCSAINFTWIRPSSSNQTISKQLNEFIVNVSDDLDTLETYEIKIWKNDMESFTWNITIKCLYAYIDYWEYETKEVYFFDEKPNITIINPEPEEQILRFHNYSINATLKEEDNFNMSAKIFDSKEKLIFSSKMENGTDGNFNCDFNPIHYTNGQYRLKIIAKNHQRNGSEEVKFYINNTRPVIIFRSPIDGDIIQEPSIDYLTISVQIDDKEGDNIESVKLKIYANNTSTSLVYWEKMVFDLDSGYYQYKLDISNIENSIYFLIVNCSDKKGYSYKEIKITIDFPQSQIESKGNDTPKDDFNFLWIPIISGIISGLTGLIVRSVLRRIKGKIKKFPKKIKDMVKKRG
jgi:hypothetical protein